MALLREYGGFELAMLVGAILRAGGAPGLRGGRWGDRDGGGPGCPRAAAGLPAVLRVRHRSAEPGHDAMLAHLGAVPLLDLGLRLGEGTGAALALPLLRAAVGVLDGMADLDAL